ncbi:integrase [Vibrio sp. JCM 19236]|nr:integrase [Vibrio sp. JCM 19236]
MLEIIEGKIGRTKYRGHRLEGLRDFSKPNFGLGSRQIGKALINASLEQVGGLKNNTHLARLPACRDFDAFLKEHTSVKRLTQVERIHIFQFVEYLRERFESEESFTPSSARDYLSHINVCLSQARGDDKLKVLATKELYYPSKTGIAIEDRSIHEEAHKYLIANVRQPVSVLAQLQRAFGLRMREASLLGSNKAYQEAKLTGVVTVPRGTKGGQSRQISISNTSQLSALMKGVELQSITGHDNLVPKNQTFKSFQSSVWRE